ncbi:MAG: helix-turn-helix transcriptional regulator [Thermodesulfovibrionales bacterium]|nr:helix-turn-helix transcriptional regulator [Thermodesulfovibrionales bacterium]
MENKLGERLSQVRGSLSKAAFARELGVQPPYIGMLESGKSTPSETLTKLICAEFKINKEWLLTGKGWAYTPFAPYQATEWMLKQLNANTKRILIVKYEDYKIGTPYGFVLEKEKGSISMWGTVTRSDPGYRGGRPNAYRDILIEMKAKGVQVDKIKLTETESAHLNDIDLSSLFSNPNIIRDVIDKELHSKRPEIYSEKMPQILPEEKEEEYRRDQRLRNAFYGKNKDLGSDPEIAEIIDILINDPETKKYVLKILKGRTAIKEAMEGLSGLSDKK